MRNLITLYKRCSKNEGNGRRKAGVKTRLRCLRSRFKTNGSLLDNADDESATGISNTNQLSSVL